MLITVLCQMNENWSCDKHYAVTVLVRMCWCVMHFFLCIVISQLVSHVFVVLSTNYTVVHKKRATFIFSITLANIDGCS